MLPPVDNFHEGTRPMNPLESWRLEQGYTYRRLGQALGVTTETARRYCLARGEKLARTPPPALLEQIARLTDGAVKPADFGVA